MAIYQCGDCDQFYDDDYAPCSKHPADDTALICDDCLPFFDCEYCGEQHNERESIHHHCAIEYVAEQREQQRKDDRLTGDL